MPDDNCCAVRIVLIEEAPRVTVCFEPAPPAEPADEDAGGPLFNVPRNLSWFPFFA